MRRLRPLLPKPTETTPENSLADASDTRPIEQPEIKRKLIVKKIVIFILVILIIMAIAGGVAAFQISKLVTQTKKTIDVAREAYNTAKNQDLAGANQQLEEVKSNLEQTHNNFLALRWTAYLPFAGRYWYDGNHAIVAAQEAVVAADILVDAVEPYADVLGFKGQGSFLGGTAEDRIVKAVETLDKVTPELDAVAQKLEIVTDELEQIDSRRYRFSYEGKRVDELIDRSKEVSEDALFAVTKAKPAIEALPDVMGVEAERKYMVLFQNDAELRATGGFMTAYAILRVEKGKVFQEKSEDIYALDNRFNSRIPAPEIIRKYLPLVYVQNLRDINLSPDYRVSMDAFSEHYNKISGEPKIDGIIAVDTQVLKNIIDVLGPIEVPDFGTYSAENDPRCDCPQVVYELEALADRPLATFRENRKGILAPMLQAILLKSYATPKQLWPDLLQTIIRNINEKHVLFYMNKEEEQKAAELINVAGRIRSDFDADYFHLNDTNFAGAKSNMFITQEVEQSIKVMQDGSLEKTVTIKYQNPFPASNCNLEAGELCLNGIMRDFVRVYVPKGSQLIEALGSEVEVETKQDLGKTVFEGFFKLQPKNQAKLIFKYTIPFKADSSYRLLIQKQPGTRNPRYIVTTPSAKEEFELLTDKELTLPL